MASYDNTVKSCITRHIGIIVDLPAFQRTCHQAVALGLDSVWCDYTTLNSRTIFQ
ncbi:hypothetical protein [Methanoculleus sp.]|uniref:hypothetical protein n=1 Tax=Methanoculleus sp. TaxID=90427 RepID=UPI002631A385|nr:hypothetical protein [Methanoculleus sp.]MDI6867908.1 hypothetical protein [Methanoculleus sp.]